MDRSEIQERIDRINWYHEFDFGDGLKATSRRPERPYHRMLWRSIEEQLNKIDFQGKTVLDIGCWDGYWSFYAERRGARSVLATDDQTQNTADGSGLLLAKELLGSSVTVRQDLSVYELASLKQTFDIILFLGVFYHLYDPFYAFAQIRHRCNRDTVLLIDGAEGFVLPPGVALFDFPNHGCEFLPSLGALSQILKATYFTLTFHEESDPVSINVREGECNIMPLKIPADLSSLPIATNRRIFLACSPFEGNNDLYVYRPPFDLHVYDSRFRDR